VQSAVSIARAYTHEIVHAKSHVLHCCRWSVLLYASMRRAFRTCMRSSQCGKGEHSCERPDHTRPDRFPSVRTPEGLRHRCSRHALYRYRHTSLAWRVGWSYRNYHVESAIPIDIEHTQRDGPICTVDCIGFMSPSIGACCDQRSLLGLVGIVQQQQRARSRPTSSLLIEQSDQRHAAAAIQCKICCTYYSTESPSTISP
jgi:hypothetical protein